LIPIRFEKISGSARMPERAHLDDIAFDLYASATTSIPPESIRMVPTGLKIDLPRGMAALICARSGLATKGITVMNSPGLIDPGYRGEIMVILYNANPLRKGYAEKVFNIGDKIAQLMLITYPEVKVEEVEFLSNDTDRGTAGFGSTG